MATAHTTEGGQSFNGHDSKVTTWVLALGESGDALVDPALADRSVHFYGTFGGATVVWEGSNEALPGAANFVTLNDPFGVAISYTSGPRLKAVTEMVRTCRPRVIGGDGTTAITVKFIAKR